MPATAIQFSGRIIKARGGHAGLRIPGRDELPGAPADWPVTLFRGSLNVLVDGGGYPPEFTEHGLPLVVSSLDASSFSPAFTIPQAEMGNNQIVPTCAMPHQGTAQVWRTVLYVNEREIGCWTLRRFGSGLTRELELVSGEGIRATYGLPEGRDWPAEVRLFGAWV